MRSPRKLALLACSAWSITPWLLADCSGTRKAAGVPSDAQMVFTSHTGDLVTQDLDGTNQKQLTHDGQNRFLPHFSPDGIRLVYDRGVAVAGSALSGVFVYDFATATETQLASPGTQPIWSPDGTRIAFGTGKAPGTFQVMNADGTGVQTIGTAAGTDDDLVWGDPAWSSDNWILFVVGQLTSGGTCFKTRVDKMRPDGTSRMKVTDGGPNCTPKGREQSGDADPGFSADGKTIYSSRGFPYPAAGQSSNNTVNVVRRLYAFSSDAWFVGKPEQDLSLPGESDCIEGVPKGSRDGTRVLLFRACDDNSVDGAPGVYVTDTGGSYRTAVPGTISGFGPDWNPVWKP